MANRPDENTVLRRLVKAQDSLLLAYRIGGRPTSRTLDEALRCRRWLHEIEDEKAKRATA